MSTHSHSRFTLIVLGSGTSQGVPMIGCPCAVCHSDDLRDKRTRCSLHLQTSSISLLIDTSPELREQALREKMTQVDAVLFTHAHADHIMGLDDLRRFCDLNQAPMPIYGSEETLRRIEKIFDYAFLTKTAVGYARVTPHPVANSFSLGDLEITPLPLPHGAFLTYGYLFWHNNKKIFAYLNDCHEVSEEVKKQIENVEILMIDGLRDEPHPTHLSIPQAIQIGLEVKASRTYLTHLTHQKTHVQREKELPEKVFLAYDGLKLEL